jgi:hypothetical protein
LKSGVPQWGGGVVISGMLRRDPWLKEVERSEEGQKISKGNMWGWPSTRIGDGESCLHRR